MQGENAHLRRLEANLSRDKEMRQDGSEKVVKPAHSREIVDYLRTIYRVMSIRRACQVLPLPRSTTITDPFAVNRVF
jgi:hypothetical protein